MLSGPVRRRDGGQKRVVCLPYAERGAPVAKSAPLRSEKNDFVAMLNTVQSCYLSTDGTLSHVLLRPHRLVLDAKLVSDVVDNFIYPPVPAGYASRPREST